MAYLNKNLNATPVYQVDGNGDIIGSTAATANQVQGNVASGSADSGNPVKVGGKYNVNAPSLANGQRSDLQLTPNGQLMVNISGLNGAGNPSDGLGNVYMGLSDGASNNRFNLGVFPWAFNGSTWDRVRGDSTGQWTHAPQNTVSSALSGTIATSGATASVAFISTARQEVINPSTSTLWASWATPTVNGAGSFQIAPGGTFSTDRTVGTLTLLSTVATQPFTVNRYS